MMRADKFVAQNGIYSRKEVKDFFKKNLVTLNGEVLKDGAVHIDENTDEVKLNGEKISYTHFVYLMMNKPAGYISATEDTHMPTVVELLPDEFAHFNPFPVGRLDIDTVGLLLLTNDGDLAHRLLSPKKKVPKVYLARVEKKVTDKDIEAFKCGIFIKEDGYTTLPGNLEVIEDGENPLCRVTICEGKFHQVKRMFAARDNKVLSLKRAEFGGLILDETLKEGEVRALSEEEEKILKGK